MNFLFPTFLFGLFAVTIPIIIHLFNFQKPKKVLFTNVKFLRDVKETTNKRLKLKHLLILLTRILFITFLVLAFAQPILKSNKSEILKGNSHVYVYLDNSFSMQNEVDKEKALNVAINSINKLTEVYPNNTQYTLLTNDFEGKDQFERNKEKLSERLTEIGFSNRFRDINSIYKRQAQVLEENSTKNNHFFLFSDFQKSTIGNLSNIKFDTSAKVYLVPIQSNEPSNIFIDSIWLSNPLVKANENNTMEVLLRNEGERNVKDLVLKLYINNIQVSTNSVSIEPNNKAKTQFVFNINGEGQKKCKITFEDFPVSFDNEYFFILNVAPKIKILHLYENGGGYVSKVFSNESVFALESNPVGDFDNSLISVSNLIVLDNLKSIPSTLVNSLKDFVRSGGSLFIYPSENPDIDSYNQLLANLYLPRFSKVNQVAGATTDSSYLKSGRVLTVPDFKNPFFKGLFEKNDKNMNMPYAFPSVSWDVRGDLLLKLKNDQPFISLFPVEKGKVYLAASPLQSQFTNFQDHSLFVLTMYKAGFNSLLESERLAYSFQDPTVTVDMDNYNSDNIYTLTSGKFSIIPGQRIVGRKLMLEVPKEELKPGFYQLKSGDKEGKSLAFNYGKEESEQKFYTPEELKAIYSQDKNVQVYSIDGADQFISKFKKENIGVPLWKYCLILSLIFLAIEIALIRFLK